MPAQRLETIRVEKPWGRHALWPGFADPAPAAAPVGEIWFEGPPESDLPLLVKYLFTSEKLSIQVHPDDAQAQAAGHARGKEEAWIVLAAEPGSTPGLGTVRPLSREALRAAALDGSIEQLIDWKPVRAGDIIYSPAGTVHAIGAGITLVEIQQNVDLTYRLFDYGRPRELHLDAGIAVSDPRPFVAQAPPRMIAGEREILVEGRKFVIERWRWNGARALSMPDALKGWLVPLAGSGMLDGAAFSGGECWLVEGQTMLTLAQGSDCLFAYAHPDPQPLFA